MRNLLPLLIVLLVAGCAKTPEPLVPLKPLAVDEAAAYPKQELGTRPPVLTGTLSLTKEELDEGNLLLFDGVSPYGWTVLDGNAELSAKIWYEKPALVAEKKENEHFSITHRFAHTVIFQDNGPESFFISSGPCFLKPGSTTSVTGSSGHRNRQNVYGLCTRITAKAPDSQPLLESDWKPVAGETKAAWTDGVLELTGGLGMVETVKEYGDFVLQLEYYTAVTPEGGGVNSGVFFRCIPGETLNGYECQVFNNPPAEDYDKFIGTDTGGIFRRCVGRNVGPKDNEWNYLTIAVRGPMIATWVNGVQTVDWTDTRKEDENPRKGLRLQPGTIQLQGHDPGTKIKFRNFRIAELER